MTADLRRIRAVAASLRGIRDRVTENDHMENWDTAPFDNAVRLLEDAIEDADFSGHTLEDPGLDRTSYLVHLDSLIAFLEVYETDEQASRNVVNLVPRNQG